MALLHEIRDRADRFMKSGHAIELDLNLLRVLLVVAETGSVTQAAANLCVTQPP